MVGLQRLLASTVVSEEAFSFDSLSELRDRSSIVLVATITGIDAGPAELMGVVEDGSQLFNETLAISLRDDEGTDYVLVQDYGEAVGFEAIASSFPVGARALLFGVPFTPPGNRRTPDRFDELRGSVWQTAHPLGFLVLASDGMLVPLFSQENSTPKLDTDADRVTLRDIGIEAEGVRWPDPAE